MWRPALVLVVLLLPALPACGGGGETAEESAEAVAGLLGSGDCVMLQTATASVERALGGAVGSDLAAHAHFLAGYASRAPEELVADVAVLWQAAEGLARGEGATGLDQAAVRRSATAVSAWAHTRCPG